MVTIKENFVHIPTLISKLAEMPYTEVNINYLNEIINELSHEETIEILDCGIQQ